MFHLILGRFSLGVLVGVGGVLLARKTGSPATDSLNKLTNKLGFKIERTGTADEAPSDKKKSAKDNA